MIILATGSKHRPFILLLLVMLLLLLLFLSRMLSFSKEILEDTGSTISSPCGAGVRVLGFSSTITLSILRAIYPLRNSEYC